MEYSSELMKSLDLHSGQRVLEIRMGSGDNTVQMASYVGESGLVVSVDGDEAVVRHVNRLLEERGVHNVRVYHADGLDGYTPGAPYERIISTGSVRLIPSVWLEQLVQGGILVARLAGNLTCVFLRLVKGRTTAHGKFLAIERTRFAELHHEILFPRHTRQAAFHIDVPAHVYEVAFNAPSLLSNEAFLFFLQCELPHLQRYTPDLDTNNTARSFPIFFDPILNASFTCQPCGDTSIVHVDGDEAVWQQVERCYYRWQQRGQPGPVDFHFHIKGSQQYILYPATGEVWLLPW